VNPFIRESSKRVLTVACEILSNYYPIIMKFSGYLLLSWDTSAIGFRPNRSTPLVGHAPKVGHYGLDCSIELKLSGALRRTSF